MKAIEENLVYAKTMPKLTAIANDENGEKNVIANKSNESSTNNSAELRIAWPV